MSRNAYKILSEKYSLVNETPVGEEAIEITDVPVHHDGTKSTHNVDMALTKAMQAAEVAPRLAEMLKNLSPEAPLHAWMVTHITEAADMLQDVEAALAKDEEVGM